MFRILAATKPGGRVPELNPDQQIVVNSHNGAYCCLAGPGSGKSTALIARYRSIVEKTGIKPLCLTFTAEAATNMLKKANGAKENFRTFHSLGWHICSQERGRLPFEPELRNRLLYRLMRKYGLEYKDLTAFISKTRHNSITPEQALEEDGTWKYGFPQAYAEYEKERLKAGWIDFDSMLVDSLNLLENPEVRAKYQQQYVMADEVQDTDNISWRVLQLLTEKHGNILVVGDVNQSIYAWRDAVPENLTNFTRWFSKGKFLYLGVNYRSTKSITNFVRENAPVNTPLNEKMLPARTVTGEPIEFRTFNSEQEEIESAVSIAQRDPLNSAILARTNQLLGPVEKFLIENKLPYHLLGRSGFWRQSEITRAVEKLKPFAHLKTEAAMSIIMPGLESHYQVEDATEEDNDALENLRTLREISRKFKTCQDFVQYANRAAHAKRSKGITISTVHQAKGCEWVNVFLIGARDGMIPHSKGEWGEEKRIFFVAISRAIDRLRISFVGTPSPFFQRYLTPEILASLQENVGKVERLQKQFNLLV